MDYKKIGLHNLKIHYLWTFLSSIAFLSPVMSLYYQKYGFQIADILKIGSIYTILLVVLEIPTSTLWDNWWRVKTMMSSSLSVLVSTTIYFFFPSIIFFYIAIFFSALWQALWSGTWQAKLQEDLKAAGMEKDFGTVIGKLISIQKIWQLLTPIVIYFILKLSPTNWYHFLAWLDLVVRIIVIVAIFNFKEVDISYQRIWKWIKENIKIQFQTVQESFNYIVWNSKLRHFLVLFLFSNNIFYISSIFYPAVTKLWLQDYMVSYIVWIASALMIISSWKAHIIGKYFWWRKSWWILIFISFLLNVLLFISWWNIILSIAIYIFMCMVSYLNAPTRQHIFMDLTDIRSKATTRSLVLSIYFLYQSLLLFTLSFFSIKIGILICSFILLVGIFLFGLFDFGREEIG